MKCPNDDMTTITIYKTPDVQVVVHRRERPATRDPWAALLFGGAP